MWRDFCLTVAWTSVIVHPMQSNYLSTSELAEARGVTVKTVLRWVAAGKLTPAMKLPGKTGAYLFDAAEAETEAAA